MAETLVVRSVSAGTRDSAQAPAVLVYRIGKKKKRKKSLRGMRWIDRIARRASDGPARFFETYQDRHQRSNRKKRSGWVRDLPKNLLRASKKSLKKVPLRIGDFIPL